MLASLWVGGPAWSSRGFRQPVLARRAGTSALTSTIPFCMKALLEHEIPKAQIPALAPPSDPPAFAVFGIKMIGWWV